MSLLSKYFLNFVVNIPQNGLNNQCMSKGIKDIIFYISMILIFGFLISWVIKFGSSFEVVNQASDDGVFSKSFDLFKEGLKGNIQTPIAMLLLQVVIILFIARIFGLLFVKIGQPIVIGEILAGIVLGPSVLGLFFPEVFKFLFSPSSLENINILSQIGLVLFMFVIGMELNIDEVKKKFNETILISHASIIIPFFFGTVRLLDIFNLCLAIDPFYILRHVYRDSHEHYGIPGIGPHHSGKRTDKIAFRNNNLGERGKR